MSIIQSESPKQLQRIVIVGGGTAGWMAAASLVRYCKDNKANNKVTIQLIESPAIPTVGVGEAAIPSLVAFNHSLGINEREFMKATGATFKLGIRFENWTGKGTQFFHPFSDFGQGRAGVEFHHYFYRLIKAGYDCNLDDFSLVSQIASKNSFSKPEQQPISQATNYAYSYHFDATRYANLLRTHCQGNIELIQQTVDKVNKREEDGFIDSLLLNDGTVIHGDLFIDCTGFRGLLIEQSLRTGYEDWSHWLPCDSAIAIQGPAQQEIPPYTRAIATESGWSWRIPLQHRTGYGQVFSSQHWSNEKALKYLNENTQGQGTHEPKLFSFRAGRRKKIWNKNCYALGLASGFLEPLESTSISLIQTGIAHLLQFFPDKDFNPHIIAEVNQRHRQEMESIRDFIIMHFKFCGRSDSPFWRYCHDMDIPDSLQHKYEIFRHSGYILSSQPEAFEPSSWLAFYRGFDINPQYYDTRADFPKLSEVHHYLQSLKIYLQKIGENRTSHSNFIQQYMLKGAKKNDQASY